MTDATNHLEGVRECFRQAMALDAAAAPDITERTEAADVPGWDSQGHVRLILALEERFGVEFGDDQIVELVSVAAILQALQPRA